MWCGHLLPGVGGEVEHEHGEEGDAHAGDDEVHGVEQGLPPHGDVEGDVQVGLLAARVELDVPDGGHLEDVPLHRHVELRQVDADVDDGRGADLVILVHLDQVSILVFMSEVNLRVHKINPYNFNSCSI